MPIPQKDRQRVSASGLHDRHRWRVLAMSIKTVHDSLESGQRKILEHIPVEFTRSPHGGRNSGIPSR